VTTQPVERLASRMLQIGQLRYSQHTKQRMPRVTEVKSLFRALTLLREQSGDNVAPTQDTSFSDYMMLVIIRTMRRGIDTSTSAPHRSNEAVQDMQLALKRFRLPPFALHEQQRLGNEFALAYAEQDQLKVGILASTMYALCDKYVRVCTADARNYELRRSMLRGLQSPCHKCGQARTVTAQRIQANHTIGQLRDLVHTFAPPDTSVALTLSLDKEWEWLSPYLLTWPGGWRQLIQLEQGQSGPW
jgi:hypothetical protein